VSPFDLKGEYLHLDGLPDESATGYDVKSVKRDGQPAALVPAAMVYYAVVLLDRPVTTVLGATLIASHLDTDIHATTCRLAVMGNIVCTAGLEEPDAWRSIRAVKFKQKRISIDRIVDTKSCIAKGFVRPKEGVDAKLAGAQMFADVQRFIGMSVHGTWPRTPQPPPGAVEIHAGADARCKAPPSDAVVGRIDSAFGKTGKVRIVFESDVFVVPAVKPSSHRGRGRGRGRGKSAAAAAPSGKQQEGGPAAENGESDEEKEEAAEDAATKDDAVSSSAPSSNGTPNVRLYFYSKKYPFAQHCPLQQ
jgi:selenocysteine-specific elongation factor